MSRHIQQCIVAQPGPAGVLRLIDAPAPALGPGSARVEIRAAALNFRDIHIRRGTGDMTAYPVVPGSDFAGLITELADDVTDERLAVGARVVGFAAQGAYATEVVVPARLLQPLPEHIEDALASTLPTAGFTALFLCSSTKVGPGAITATWAAAGGLGCYLGAIVSHLGATSIGITSNSQKQTVALNAGHHYAFNHRDPELVATVRSVAPGGADVVFDSVGGPNFTRSFQMTADHGQVVICGRAGGEPNLADVTAEFIAPRRNLALRDFSLMGHLVRNIDDIPRRTAELIDVITNRPGCIPITTYPLADAAAAHEEMESGSTVGKLVLLPG